MGMLGTREYMQLLEHLAAQRVLRQHALDRKLQRAFRMLSQQLFQAGGFEIAQIAGVMMIELVG